MEFLKLLQIREQMLYVFKSNKTEETCSVQSRQRFCVIDAEYSILTQNEDILNDLLLPDV